MRKVLFLALVIVACASLAFAQNGGGIIIASDMMGIDCNLHDSAPGLASYFAVHVPVPGSITDAIASQWSAPIPACMVAGAAIWLSDTQVFPVTIGNSQAGVAIGYGTCYTLPVHVLTINYFVQGLTPPCCLYRPGPDPSVPSGMIEIVDCNNVLLYGVGVCAIVNADPSCPCQATPVKESTWGKVKSLYSE